MQERKIWVQAVNPGGERCAEWYPIPVSSPQLDGEGNYRLADGTIVGVYRWPVLALLGCNHEV